MDILNEFKIPALSDEGIMQTILIYKELFKKGTMVPSIYISSLLDLTGEKKAINKEKNNYNQLDYELILKMLNAMKEDIQEYGIDEFIKTINSQNKTTIYTKENIYKAINYPHEMILTHIKNKTIHVLPIIIQDIYKNRNLYADQTSFKSLPYIHKKNVVTTGSEVIRVYLNNPLGEKGEKFYDIITSMLIKKRIVYLTKYNYYKEPHKDKTIMYFSSKDTKKIIDLFDEIGSLYPEIINDFGSPPSYCAVKSYYGICHGGLHPHTYNMFIDYVTALVFLFYWCNQIVYNSDGLIHKIDPEDRQVIMKLSHGLTNKKVLEEVKNFKKPIYMLSKYNYLLEKYKDKVDVQVSTDLYRDMLLKTVSYYTYGDLTTAYQIPFAFSKEMISALELSQNKTLS